MKPMEKVFKFALDTKCYTATEEIEVVSGDIGTNKFEIQLREEEVSVIDITNRFCKIHFKKPDGKIVIQNASIKNATKGTIECILKSNTIAVPGKVIAEVGIYENENSVERLTSAIFSFIVRESIMSDTAIHSTDEIPALDQLISEFKAAKVEQETAFATSESNRQNTFNNSESQRQNEFSQIKTEYEEAIASGSDLEVVTGRTDLDGTTHDNLKTRLNSDAQKVKDIAERVNRKDSITISLEPVNKIKSVIDSYGGACGFEVEGALVEQVAVNGDFSDYSNWVEHQSTMSISIQNRIVKLTGKITSAWGGIKSQQILKPNKDDKYFLYSRCRQLGNVENGISLSIIKASDFQANGNVVSGSHGSSTEWNEIFGVQTVASTEFSLLSITCGATDINNNSIEVDGNAGVFVIKLQGDDINLTPDELKTKYVDAGYFEGLQPLRGVAVEAVSKNLFDISKASLSNADAKISNDGETITLENKANVYAPAGNVDIPIYLEQGKSYTFTANIQNISGSLPFEVAVIENLEPYSRYVNYDGVFTATRTGVTYIRLYQYSIGKNTCKIQLEEGATPTTYEPRISSKIVIDDPIAKLPNGVADKITHENGKTTIQKRVWLKYLSNSDIIYNGDTASNSVFSINKPNDSVFYNNIPDSTVGKFVLEGFVENLVSSGSALSNYQVTTRISTTSITLAFPLGTNLTTAQSFIKGKLLACQLATPQTIELLDELEPLNSYKGYTQFSVGDGLVENEKANLTLNTANTYYHLNNLGSPDIIDSPLNHKVKAINKVYYEGIDITSLGTLNEAFSFGKQRWFIAVSVVEENNIDITKIRTTYTTLDTNGQSNAKITYNADLSSAVSSNASAVNIVGEQTDRNTEEIEHITSVEEFQPIPLNGASVNTGDKHGIRVVNGYVEGFGALTVSGVSSGIVVLNTGDYTPIKSRSYRVCGNSMATTIDIQVRSDGDWKLYYTGDAPTYFYLDQIRFKAGD